MGLIAGSDKIAVTPNFAPEWVSQPTPSFIASTTASYDLSVNTFDANGDTLVYAVSSGSTALSSAFTLTSAGILQADGTQGAGNITGVIFDVSDGVAAPVASNAFTIAVTVQSNSAPSLFEDFGGNAFNGEAGALAVNDDWASTVYQYIPQYAPTIGTVPTPTTTPTDITGFTTSQENPNASDEYLVCTSDAEAGLAAAINDSQYKKIFIYKGCDCTDGTDNQILRITQSGTAVDPRWFVYYDPAGAIDVETFAGAPWNQSAADRVQMPFIPHGQDGVSSCSYIRWVGLSWGVKDGQKMRQAIMYSGSDNNIWYRCNNQNATSHAWTNQGGDSNYVYQCVSSDHQNGTGDVHCYVILGGDDVRVVSCEGWDFLGDFFQIENAGASNPVCEDCDIYQKTFYDGSGNIDVTGTYGPGEGGIDIKALNSASSGTGRFYGNRIWDLKPPDETHTGQGGSGSPIRFSNTEAKYKADVRWNICFDCSDGGLRFNNIDLNNGGNHSIVRNIFYSISGDSQSGPTYVPDDACEGYLNTMYDCLGCQYGPRFFRSDTGGVDGDWMGNSFVDVKDVPSFDENDWNASFTYGYNAYAGTYTVSSKGYSSDYEAASKAALNMGDFKFKRKKLTVNGGETHTLSGIVPTTSTPAGFSLVPTTGGDQIGTKTGMGVDDVS